MKIFIFLVPFILARHIHHPHFIKATAQLHLQSTNFKFEIFYPQNVFVYMKWKYEYLCNIRFAWNVRIESDSNATGQFKGEQSKKTKERNERFTFISIYKYHHMNINAMNIGSNIYSQQLCLDRISRSRAGYLFVY